MKILLVNDYGGATGGAEIQMLALRDQLRARGHDVRLFSSRAELVEDSPILADYTCYGTTSRAQVVSQTFNFSAYFTLRKVLDDFQPDVVHVRMFLWQLSPLILRLLQFYPALYQTAVYKAICPIGTRILPDGNPCSFAPGKVCLQQGCLTPQTWIFMMAQQQLWQRWQSAFDCIVALSHGMKRTLELAGVSRPIRVIYNGVPMREARPALQSPPTVGYAGRFSAEKGLETLLRAFAKVANQVPKATLKMAGKGVLEPSLKALSEQLGIAKKIVWLGHMPRAEMEQAFDSVWVQAVPSLWAEPFGNVTTEAMMRGTAVVASAVGAQPEIVGSGQAEAAAGVLVPPGDDEALAAALLPILQQRSHAEAMGKVGRDRALSEFSEARCVESFLDLYRELSESTIIDAPSTQYLPI